MNNWEKIKIGDLCQSIVPGRNKPKVFDGDIPWINTPDIKSRYIPSSNHEVCVSRQEIKRCGGKTVPTGSVIMACVGDLGLVAIAKKEIVINQQLHAFVCPERLHNEYIAYALEAQKTQMYRLASLTTIPYLNKSNCENLVIPCPPYQEQKAIASLLETWDTAIEKAEALIEAKEKRFKWLLKTLISDQQDNPEWQEVRLEETGAIHSGGTPSTTDGTNWGGSIYWLIPSEVTKIKDRFIRTTERTITEKGVTQTTLLPIKCLIVCTRATIGDACINTVPMAINQGFKCIEPAKDCHVDFLYYSMMQHKNDLVRLANGSTFGEVSKKDFANIKILLPQFPKQKAIASLLDTAQREINLLEQFTKQYRTQKRGLMQKLLTGEWRVKN